MNQTTLHHLRALEAHHLKALNSVRDLIRLEVGESIHEKHEVITPPSLPALPAPCNLLNRAESFKQIGARWQKPTAIRKAEDIVIDALSILEQDTFSTGDVLRVIKHAFPSEFNSRHHTAFRTGLTKIARTGVIRLERQGVPGRGSVYSK